MPTKSVHWTLQLVLVAALSNPACSETGGPAGAIAGTGAIQSALPDPGASGGTGGAASARRDASASGGTGGAASARRDAGASGTSGAMQEHGPGRMQGTGGAGTVTATDAGIARDAGTDGGTSGTTSPSPSCLDTIADYEHGGPFQFETKTAGAVRFWIPGVPAGCKVPVVHFANGTGATCTSYVAILERLASHGFLAACYEDPNTSAGTQCITAVEAAFTMFPDLADKKIASIAHGGAAAFTCVQLAEAKWGRSMIYTGLAMQPESGSGPVPDWMATYAKITSPMFMFGALGTDGLVSQAWVQQSFDALSSTDEAYFWTVNGLKFIPVSVSEANEVSIPWLRWKLLGDRNACAFFSALPTTDTRWALTASRNAQPCH